MIEIVEITLEKISAGTLHHRSRTSRYEQYEFDELMIYPEWTRYSLEHYLSFATLSDEQLKEHNERRYGEHDIVYQVGDKDIVLMTNFQPVANAMYHQTPIETVISDLGMSYFETYEEQLVELLKPIWESTKPPKYSDTATMKILTLWEYIPTQHDYGDGIEYDFEVHLLGLLQQSDLNTIANAVKEANKLTSQST